MVAIGRKKFSYECGYCTNSFVIEKNEDLKHVMIRCPRCRNFLRKNEYKDVTAISKIAGMLKK